MKIKINTLILMVTLFTVCSFTDGDNNKKKISNNLYSFYIPSHWEPANGIAGDGTVPGERDIEGYHLYYMMWTTPIRSAQDAHSTIGLFIESYQRKKDPAVSIEEIEKLEMSKIQGSTKLISKEVIDEKVDQKRFIITKLSREMDGSMVQYLMIYLLYKSGNITHCITISSSKTHYLLPETQVLVKEILDSFLPVKQQDIKL